MSKTAIVTGGTKGIGKAVCARLLSEGWTVLATFAADTTAAGNVLDTFEQVAPGRFFILQADCAELSSLSLIDEYLKDRNLTVDAVVFNAGLTDRTPFEAISIEGWRRVFTANVDFPVFLLQRLYNRLNEYGCVVFTGSLMGIQPHALSLAYGVSKASVHALVKNLVKFFTSKHIRINAVAPGFVETDWHTSKSAEVRQHITENIATGSFCSPEDLSDVYLMLINNAYMNGEVVVCDGAYSYK